MTFGEQNTEEGMDFRQKRRPSRRARVQTFREEFTRRRRRSRSRGGPKKASPQAKAIKRRVSVDGTISVANLAHGMSIKSGQIIKKLIEMGQMATANDELDLETAQLVAAEFGYRCLTDL